MPSRTGAPRWRYTHAGVVYITDETSRHEITSWRLVDAALERGPEQHGALSSEKGTVSTYGHTLESDTHIQSHMFDPGSRQRLQALRHNYTTTQLHIKMHTDPEMHRSTHRHMCKHTL